MAAQINKLELTRQARGDGIASQQTHVEVSRAVAQVQGALVVARQNPRDEIAAADRMRNACRNPALAARAFFAFQRAGSSITGPSIHLATELARCWGNIDYGIVELSRGEGQSEMLAYAWDLETNLRATNSFIAPHVRDTKKGPVALTDARDLYENNANLAARRLREMIFRVLPVYVREEAEALCRHTLEHGGGEPIEQRRVKLLEAFGALGITRRRIERRVGRPADRFTALDIATLGVVYQTLRRGETTAEAEFPDDAGGDAADELRAKAPKADEPAPAQAVEVAQAAEHDADGEVMEVRLSAGGKPRFLAPAAAADLIAAQARKAPHAGAIRELLDLNPAVLERMAPEVRAGVETLARADGHGEPAGA